MSPSEHHIKGPHLADMRDVVQIVLAPQIPTFREIKFRNCQSRRFLKDKDACLRVDIGTEISVPESRHAVRVCESLGKAAHVIEDGHHYIELRHLHKEALKPPPLSEKTRESIGKNFDAILAEIKPVREYLSRRVKLVDYPEALAAYKEHVEQTPDVRKYGVHRVSRAVHAAPSVPDEVAMLDVLLLQEWQRSVHVRKQSIFKSRLLKGIEGVRDNLECLKDAIAPDASVKVAQRKPPCWEAISNETPSFILTNLNLVSHLLSLSAGTMGEEQRDMAEHAEKAAELALKHQDHFRLGAHHYLYEQAMALKGTGRG